VTDGTPSDIALYREMVPKIKNLGFGAIIACAAGPKAKSNFLKELTDTVIYLDAADSKNLTSFFKSVCSTIEKGSKSMNINHSMPSPPPS
jgi:uncharacterized protein YegL